MTREEIREHCNAYGYSDEEVGAFLDGMELGRAGVLDEFLKELYPCKYKHNDDCSLCKGIRYCLVFESERIAEQMKEQGND